MRPRVELSSLNDLSAVSFNMAREPGPGSVGGKSDLLRLPSEKFVLAMTKSSAKESIHLNEWKPAAAQVASPMSPKFRTLYVVVMLSFTRAARRRILFRC